MLCDQMFTITHVLVFIAGFGLGYFVFPWIVNKFSS